MESQSALGLGTGSLLPSIKKRNRERYIFACELKLSNRNSSLSFDLNDVSLTRTKMTSNKYRNISVSALKSHSQRVIAAESETSTSDAYVNGIESPPITLSRFKIGPYDGVNLLLSIMACTVRISPA